MNKKIYHFNDVKHKIIKAVDIINNPVRQTLTPKGGNVIYEDDRLNQHYTNDGASIVSSINVKDPVENAIIEIIKSGSRKTNIEAGDGTSSTVILSSVLIKEGLRMIDSGFNQMDIRDNLKKFADDMKIVLKQEAIKINSDNDIKLIAKISASNDDNIANNVVKIIKIVGEDGQVMIEKGYTPETEIIEDAGFVIRSGVFIEELANKQYQSSMLDVPVLITDKRIYYKSEAETILNTVLDAGYNEVVIVASDFIGEALPFFVANHKNNKVKVILITEKKLDILEDLASYLGTEVISDKKGNIVNNISINDFAISKKVFSDPGKSIISRDVKEKNKDLEDRIKTLRTQLKKVSNKQDPEYINLQKRISSLTTGMVTLRVGGDTELEIMEKAHRYEDAINASRCAIKDGYLPGAGIAVYHAFNKIKINPDYEKLFKSAVEVNIRQIAENCGKNPDVILLKINENKNKNFGYNAVTDKIEDVVKAGIIEPFLVTTQVISNAVSIANIIITSRYLIVNDIEEINNKDNKN